jgi:mono/diheme cytochrome c family protein
MVRIRRQIATAVAVAALAACQSGATGTTPAAPSQPQPSAPAEPAAERPAAGSADLTTADGIFTAAQAARGQELYRAVCSECHDTADWTEAGFRNRWEEQSVFQLWYYINDRMPYDDPFSLTRQQVTDALTYILELNGLPAGDTELGTEDDDIDDYWIAWSAAN